MGVSELCTVFVRAIEQLGKARGSCISTGLFFYNRMASNALLLLSLTTLCSTFRGTWVRSLFSRHRRALSRKPHWPGLTSSARIKAAVESLKWTSFQGRGSTDEILLCLLTRSQSAVCAMRELACTPSSKTAQSCSRLHLESARIQHQTDLGHVTLKVGEVGPYP